MAGEREDPIAFDATAAATDRSPGVTVGTADAPVTGRSRELPEVDDDRYAIGAEIGRGGLGRVLRARDAVLERSVALKQLFATDDGSRRRFLREVLITARLQHPSIVPVYDAGRREDHSPFYAMKLVAGQPLELEITAASTLDKRLALIPTVLAVADAVAYAHSERIIHRDLKPANILVGKYGETIVIDWGLAKDLAIDDRDALPIGPYRSVSTAHTVAGSVMGTPGYMAPEQAAGEDADERADVYALGAILYHVISGALPHQGTTLEDVIAKVIKGDIRPLLSVEPSAPSDLAAIVSKAMAVDKEQRYRDAGALAEDLRKFQTGQLVGAHRYTTADRVRRWVRKNRAFSAVTAIATIVLVVFATWSIRRVLSETRIATEQRDEAVAKSNRAILNQARALRQEPARLLTVLGTMDAKGPGWDAARVLAADGFSQPRLVAQTRGPEGRHSTLFASARFELTRDGKRAIAFDWAGVWIMDLVAMQTNPLRFGNDPAEIRRLEVCDDGTRAYLLSGGYGHEPFHEVDVLAKTIVKREGRGPAYTAAVTKCKADFGLLSSTTGLIWRDPATAKDVTLSTIPMDAAWFALDRVHVVGLDRAGGLRRFDLAGKELGAIRGPKQPPPPPQLDQFDGRPIAAAAMSFDGSTAIVRAHGTYTFWSFAHRLSVQPKLAKSITGVAVSRDGAIGYLSTPTGGYEIKNGPDPLDEVMSEVPRGTLELSPDGAWLVGVSDEGNVGILDLATLVQQQLRGHPGAETIAFTPEGKLVTAGADALRVWDLGKPGRSHGRVGVHAAAFSPDGRWLAIDNGSSVTRWDVEGRKAEATIERDRSTSGESNVAITNAAEIVYTIKDRVFRWPRNAPARELGRQEAAVAVSPGVLPDGTPITVSHDRVMLWLAAGPREIRLPTEAARRPGSLPFVVDNRGSRALVTCRPKGETRRTCVVELASGKVDVLAETTDRVAMTPDGRIAITGLDSEAYAIWDLDRLTPILKPTSVGAVTELGLSRDGKRGIVGGLGGVDSIDLATMTVTELVSSERADGKRLQFSPDGKTVVGDDLVLRDVATGELRKLSINHEAWYLSDTALTVVTQFGIVVAHDDLPRDGAGLKDRLLALPYRLDKHDQLIVRP